MKFATENRYPTDEQDRDASVQPVVYVSVVPNPCFSRMGLNESAECGKAALKRPAEAADKPPRRAAVYRPPRRAEAAAETSDLNHAIHATGKQSVNGQDDSRRG